jgi:hypothetical protein
MTLVDRKEVVRRHTVEMAGIDPRSPLSVGNGELCLTVDVTGLQTFPEQYPVSDPGGGVAGTLLGTLSQWGWHSVPRPDGVDLADTRRPYPVGSRQVLYVDSPPQSGSDDSGLDQGRRWLRANPHRLDLARIGLVIREASETFRAPSVEDLGATRQVLDLWAGVIRSDIVLAGQRLHVTTACHPDRDAIAIRVECDADHDSDHAGAVAVRLAFPYGSQSWNNAADWSRPGDHGSVVQVFPGGALISRHFDGATDPTYGVRCWTPAHTHVRHDSEHEVIVSAQTPVLELVVELTPSEEGKDLPALGVDELLDACRQHWPSFWGRGAALDLAGSTDPRAGELERRAVLSQYLTAIQCAGSLPPQETGLTCNSWRGRFHLEMHWWHAAHFALWGRGDLLEPSMDWYRRALASAQKTAREQGYRGARWPKQVGPDARESPSDIGPFLLWQQPHVIYLAELLRRAGHDAGASERYGELVDQTARFMADVAELTSQGFALGPPLVPAQESYAAVRDRAMNPPFELAYWSWALGVAQQWRVRCGLPPEPLWDDVGGGMVRPLVRDGRYEAIGVEPFTIRRDHPSMVYALGFVPATEVVDPDVVRSTLSCVLDDWDWDSTWGWDYPALAMTATRLGEPQRAIDVLLRDTPKNTFLANGHNHQSDSLPLYLPGNGGLLAALALMIAGWDGDGGRPCPGFPSDGSWVVRHEGFMRSP